ncbi:SpoIIIAH-like family protein [Paenibacillus chitinolyticus]|uniref:SpoIIIAH-like family protein n=1 Tax=Paenibacillus chitinolyticus TaxID=79263 RepID=UPI002DB8CB25|nr:SpoIIIAH-like family protein [Paenibacillus chitinolyticus]MEC0249247.1 SpoIIIAH-like family protein [Paenibacillus chitinolyticus]
MNAKRQTIWLVSMLSLMVVLSAYYLFTEDVSKVDVASTAPKADEVKIDLSQVSPEQAVAEAGKASADKAADAKASDTKTTADAKTDAKTDTKTDAKAEAKAGDAKAQDSKTDATASKDGKDAAAAPASAEAKVSQQTQASSKSGRDYLTKLQLDRQDALSKKTEELLTLITDKNQSSDAVSKAQQELQQIEDTNTRVTNVEDVLSKDYPNAVLTQDGSKWKVTVQSDKLEKSQAVSIVETVMKELKVGPEISVQYVK